MTMNQYDPVMSYMDLGQDLCCKVYLWRCRPPQGTREGYGTAQRMAASQIETILTRNEAIVVTLPMTYEDAAESLEAHLSYLDARANMPESTTPPPREMAVGYIEKIKTLCKEVYTQMCRWRYEAHAMPELSMSRALLVCADNVEDILAGYGVRSQTDEERQATAKNRPPSFELVWCPEYVFFEESDLSDPVNFQLPDLKTGLARLRAKWFQSNYVPPTPSRTPQSDWLFAHPSFSKIKEQIEKVRTTDESDAQEGPGESDLSLEDASNASEVR